MTAAGDAGPAASFLARLDTVERRFAAHAMQPPAGLSEPDPSTGERWDAGQVWAHVAEFIPYWLEQARHVLAASSPEPVPFGRVRTDPSRVIPIEQGRYELPLRQLERLRAALADLRAFLSGLDPASWSARGQHPTLGVMDLARIIDEFMVKHLEEHAEQLDRMSR